MSTKVVDFADIISLTSATKWHFNSSGTLVASGANSPAIDHDPGASNAPQGMVIEEARTNLNIRSSEFANAAWYKNASAAITATTGTAPDGTASADTWNGSDYITNAAAMSVTAGSTYTASIFVKAGTATSISFSFQQLPTYSSAGNTTINPATGAITVHTGTGTVTDAGSGWYRYSVAGTIAALQTSARLVFTSSNGTALFWGAQFELGAFPTSYIPTTSSTVARAADVASISDMTWLNLDEGTFLFSGKTPLARIAGNDTIVDVTNPGDDNNRHYIYRQGSTDDIRYYEVSAGTSYANQGAVAVADNTSLKFAVAYKANDFATSLNGAAVVADTAGAVPTANTIMYIGHDRAGNNSWNGHIAQLKYYPRRLTNALLQEIST